MMGPGTAIAPPLRRCHGPGRGRRRGFTLIELMVTVAVMAVVLALAAPSFGALLASNRTSTVTNELIGSLSLARSEAVRRAQPVTLLAAGAGAAGYTQGWSTFPDADANGAPLATNNPADGQPIRKSGPFSGTTVVTRLTRSAGTGPYTYTSATGSDTTYLVFTARGAIQSPAEAYFKVCGSANPSVAGRMVKVNLVGKISLDSTSVACP